MSASDTPVIPDLAIRSSLPLGTARECVNAEPHKEDEPNLYVIRDGAII